MSNFASEFFFATGRICFKTTKYATRLEAPIKLSEKAASLADPEKEGM